MAVLQDYKKLRLLALYSQDRIKVLWPQSQHELQDATAKAAKS